MLYEGFNFSDHSDFRIYKQRKELAPALYSNLVALGIDSLCARDAVSWFVAGFIPNSKVYSVASYRSSLLRDCGTPYPEVYEGQSIDFLQDSINSLGQISSGFTDIRLPSNEFCYTCANFRFCFSENFDLQPD